MASTASSSHLPQRRGRARPHSRTALSAARRPAALSHRDDATRRRVSTLEACHAARPRSARRRGDRRQPTQSRRACGGDVVLLSSCHGKTLGDRLAIERIASTGRSWHSGRDRAPTASGHRRSSRWDDARRPCALGGWRYYQRDRTQLPVRQTPFRGAANRTLDGSRPDSAANERVECPEGAPAVLLGAGGPAGPRDSGASCHGCTADDGLTAESQSCIPTRARSIAHNSHRHQRDRFDDLVVEHLQRVAAAGPPEARATAWLHDVLESDGIDAAELRYSGLTPVELGALDLLTRSPRRCMSFTSFGLRARPAKRVVLRVA